MESCSLNEREMERDVFGLGAVEYDWMIWLCVVRKVGKKKKRRRRKRMMKMKRMHYHGGVM